MFHDAIIYPPQALLKKEKRRESDQTTLARRQKQINMGKNTLGYQRYEDVVPKEKRAKHEPKTPDIFQVHQCNRWPFQTCCVFISVTTLETANNCQSISLRFAAAARGTCKSEFGDECFTNTILLMLRMGLGMS